MEQIKQYLERYQQATSREERTALLVEYQAFLKTLPADDRDQARQFMQNHLKPQIEETVKTLDALAVKADLILSQRGKIIYEGRE